MSIYRRILSTKRFLPLCITQFLEAFNDNLFKNALVIIITYQVAHSSAMRATLVSLAGALFILPFFLFSFLAGQLADKYDQARLTRIIKSVEIISMGLAAIGFYTHNLPLLFFTLFLLGCHSAFFGTIKYSILPIHLQRDELMAGNALVEASTCIAILLGTLLGSTLIVFPMGAEIVSVLGLIIAIVGFIASCWIPTAPGEAPDLKLSFRMVRETWDIIQAARVNQNIFLSILGISWFWFVGIAFLSQFPSLVHDNLGAAPQVVTLFLVLFTVGIALGSVLSQQLAKSRIDNTFVPLGVFGMSLFMFDFSFAAPSTLATNTQLVTLTQFLSTFAGWRLSVDLLAQSIFGGLYVVPLYATMQTLAKRSMRSRIIAASSVISAGFMVGSAVSVGVLLSLGFSIASVITLIAIGNTLIGFYIFKLIPHAVLKTLIRWVLKRLFDVKIQGLENYYAASQRRVIVANHVSFLDGLLLAAFLPERSIFAINTDMGNAWWIKPFINLVDAYLLDPTNPMATKALIKKVKQRQHCFIFPEGRLTMTGALMKVYSGPCVIADKAGADIVPIRIKGAQYSKFTRLRGKVKTKWFPQITLTVLPAKKFTVADDIKGPARRKQLCAELYNIMTDLMYSSSNTDQTLFAALIDAAMVHGFRRKIIQDASRNSLSYRQLIRNSFALSAQMLKTLPEDKRIGILLPNSAAAVTTFFAAHAAGKTPVMLNFSLGSHTLLSACKTAQLKTIYTSSQFIETAKLDLTALETAGINFVYLEACAKRVSMLRKMSAWLKSFLPSTAYQSQVPNALANDEAVVLFTSGSEGTPKGVVLTHKNINANRFQLAAKCDFHAQDKVLNVLPMFHSFGLTGGTLLPILAGVDVFFYPSPLHYKVVPELAYDINATILFGTDSFLANYAKHANPYDFYAIRYVFAGAEKLKAPTREAWLNKFGIRIFEGYGATETAPVLTSNTPMEYRAGSVGKFLPAIEYRLDPVPGVEEGGRLFVRGPNIMAGYLLAEDPSKLHPPHEGWYDTGDIVSIDTDGFVYIQGRAKRFAKIAGEMVSLTAVESFIQQCWPNQQHAVIAIPDERKGEQVILFTEKQDAARDEILRFFGEQGIAPIHMPKRIVTQVSLPLLSTGKVDYVGLQSMTGEF